MIIQIFRTYLYNRFLPKLLKRKCPSEIPRSGEEGKKVNCFSVAIDSNGEPSLLLRCFDSENYTALGWDGERYSIEQTISSDSVLEGGLRVTHFYGLSTITYHGIWDFALHRYTGLVYVKVHLVRAFDLLGTFRFKRKKLITKKRMELLQFLVENHITSGYRGIDSFWLMTKLYSMRWVVHPESESQYEKLKLYLDALERNGDVRKVNNEYVVQGQAINTLEKFEEDERRHSEVVRAQWLMVFLTLAIAIFTLVQAQVIKLPTILDLSKDTLMQYEHDKSFNAGADKAYAD